MPKIFRQKRQNMLGEKKSRRYLLYAIGEILLVVIGILLALQINKWNEEYNASILEKEYLERFVSEITIDLNSFKNANKNNRFSQERLTLASQILNDQSSSDSSLVRAVKIIFRAGWANTRYTPTFATYEDLSSTGQLNIIRNETLREQIINLYKDYETKVTQANLYIDKTLDAEIKWMMETDLLSFHDDSKQLFQQKSIPEQAAYIRQNIDYILRYVSITFFAKELLVRRSNEAVYVATDVLTNLEKELEQ